VPEEHHDDPSAQADLALDAIQDLKNRLAVAEAKFKEVDEWRNALLDCSEPSLVKVYMEGGVIQDMEVPAGVKVDVYDFDVEGADEERITKTPLGEECVLSEWYPN
jgi:hypothetical protein